MATEHWATAFEAPKKPFAWPRLVCGETTRERELQLRADSLQFDLRQLRTLADEQLEKVIAERDAARKERDAAWTERNAAWAERDDLAGRIAVGEKQLAQVLAERDAMWRERDAAIAERDAAIAERDEAHSTRNALRAEVKRSFRYYIKDLSGRHAAVMRQIERQMTNWQRRADEMLAYVSCGEANDSQDDRPATDCGADGSGTTDEPTT